MDGNLHSQTLSIKPRPHHEPRSPKKPGTTITLDNSACRDTVPLGESVLAMLYFLYTGLHNLNVRTGFRGSRTSASRGLELAISFG